MVSRDLVKDFMHIIILLVLVFGLLFLITWGGVIKCKTIPGWCNIYWGIVGQPKVLIVYGSGGLGDHLLLQQYMSDPKLIGVKPNTMNVNNINTGNLKNYSLVIVEEAKEISTEKLKAFIEYVNGGGRLVWTGDAGTELAQGDEYLYADEKTEGATHEIIGPWTRKTGEDIISFDQLLSVNYVGNFCELKTCTADTDNYVGTLLPEASSSDPLVFGMASNLRFHVRPDEDFAIVKSISGTDTSELLSVQYGSNIYTNEQKLIGSSSPLIIKSGFGGRVAYYAMPPELYANPNISSDYQYTLPVENMYVGMLWG